MCGQKKKIYIYIWQLTYLLALKAASLPDSGFPSFSPSLAWPCIPSRVAFLPWVQHTCMVSSFSLSPNSALHKRGWPGTHQAPGPAGRGQWGSWPETGGQKALLSVSPWWHPLPGQPLLQVASAPGLWELSPPVFVSWCHQRLPPVANFWFLFSSVWLLRASAPVETTYLHYVPFAVHTWSGFSSVDTLVMQCPQPWACASFHFEPEVSAWHLDNVSATDTAHVLLHQMTVLCEHWCAFSSRPLPGERNMGEWDRAPVPRHAQFRGRKQT